ncbi:MAG: M20/M25/M40 family metallo-hydrolase, partial [Desulfobacterales bacterium]|nr:M20/M25/M40 family metallo-hydrolase [Desulfobacterales bacterium]
NDSEFVKSFLDVTGIDTPIAVGFTTDGPHFAHFGAPIVIFGPGDPAVCHKPDEYIEIADVEKAKELYKDIIVKFLT